MTPIRVYERAAQVIGRCVSATGRASALRHLIDAAGEGASLSLCGEVGAVRRQELVRLPLAYPCGRVVRDTLKFAPPEIKLSHRAGLATWADICDADGAAVFGLSVGDGPPAAIVMKPSAKILDGIPVAITEMEVTCR